jgi:hypothetical protein
MIDDDQGQESEAIRESMLGVTESQLKELQDDVELLTQNVESSPSRASVELIIPQHQSSILIDTYPMSVGDDKSEGMHHVITIERTVAGNFQSEITYTLNIPFDGTTPKSTRDLSLREVHQDFDPARAAQEFIAAGEARSRGAILAKDVALIGDLLTDAENDPFENYAGSSDDTTLAGDDELRHLAELLSSVAERGMKITPVIRTIPIEDQVVTVQRNDFEAGEIGRQALDNNGKRYLLLRGFSEWGITIDKPHIDMGIIDRTELRKEVDGSITHRQYLVPDAMESPTQQEDEPAVEDEQEGLTEAFAVLKSGLTKTSLGLDVASRGDVSDVLKTLRRFILTDESF